MSISIAAVLLLRTLTYAQVPLVLGYQGRLLGADGLPVSGPVGMEFGLYDAAGSKIWSESQTVGLTDGFYATYLGSVTPLGGVVDGRDLFLELSVNGTTLAPRQRIASVPYALACKSIVGGATSERGGLFTDVARGHKASITAGALKDFGPTGETPDSYWTTSTFASSMTVDLGRVVPGIFEVAFESYPRGKVENIPAYEGSGAYQLEYSEDGSKWTAIPAVVPVSGDFFDHKLKSVQARQFRLTLKVAATPGNAVSISMFRVLSFSQGESTAIDGRRIYGGEVALDDDNGHQVKMHFGNRALWGSNPSGNLHIDSDKSKPDGRIYMNYYDGKGVVFGNGTGASVATVDTAGNINAVGAYHQNGVAFKGVVAGGTCLNGRKNSWDPRMSTFGGASCSGYKGTYGDGCPGNAGLAELTCPAGAVKIVTFSWSACSDGGEGGICVR